MNAICCEISEPLSFRYYVSHTPSFAHISHSLILIPIRHVSHYLFCTSTFLLVFVMLCYFIDIALFLQIFSCFLLSISLCKCLSVFLPSQSFLKLSFLNVVTSLHSPPCTEYSIHACKKMHCLKMIKICEIALYTSDELYVLYIFFSGKYYSWEIARCMYSKKRPFDFPYTFFMAFQRCVSI
jgi:hypothetical protein